MPLSLASLGNERAFFEIAATLIPLLLFGGVIAERAKPPPEDKWRFLQVLVAPYLPLFGALALFAEAVAIRSMVAGDATAASRDFVAFVLVAGMTVVVMGISEPWLSGLRKADPHYHRWVAPVVRLVLLLSGIGAFALLIQGTDAAIQKEDFDAYQRAYDQNRHELEAVGRHSDALTLELSRLERQLAISDAHGDVAAVKALSVEINTLSRRIRHDLKEESRLFGEAADLSKEQLGERP